MEFMLYYKFPSDSCKSMVITHFSKNDPVKGGMLMDTDQHERARGQAGRRPEQE